MMTSMEKIKGLPVYKDIGFGRLLFLNRDVIEIKDISTEDTHKELARFELAKNKALEELKSLYRYVLETNGEDAAEIFEVHQMMLLDDDFLDAIKATISEKKTSEYAISKAAESLQETFLALDDHYLRARATDVKDISQRLLNILTNKTINLPDDDCKYIILSNDLLPSETLHLDMNKIAGFVMFEGSINSHAAILARMKEIPTIVQTSLIDSTYENKEAIIDSVDGVLYINPDDETKSSMKQSKVKLNQKQETLNELKKTKTLTKDGTSVHVMSNISHHSDVEQVLEKGSEGIGLFRTEFLFINQSTYPTEEEQFKEYKKVLSLMKDKQVIIRTMDIGTDKTADYFELPEENNPALGYRAIRISLDRPKILITQLRALLRATVFGNLGIMFPMITSVWEIQALKNHLREAEIALIKEGVTVNPYQIGIMIETPAAAIISDQLAKEVDFFSVGTNDLIQYTLAVDRQNNYVRQYENPTHTAILRLIEMASRNIHQYPNKWIGICGELGANLDLTEFFVGIGIDELSVSPAFVLPLREKILTLNKKDCLNIVNKFLDTSK